MCFATRNFYLDPSVDQFWLLALSTFKLFLDQKQI